MAEKGKVTDLGKKNTAYLVVAIIVVLLVACGIYYFTKNKSQLIAPIDNLPAGPLTYNVDISPNGFNSNITVIKVGDSILWTNSDTSKHTVTSDRYNELHSPILVNGNTYKHTFAVAGNYSYHSEISPRLFKGIIIVE